MTSIHAIVFLLLCSTILMSTISATQYKVGDSNGWTLPANSNAMSYSQWAERHRFRIGDSLLFVYHPDQDSVFLVDANSYRSCNTSSYIDAFHDGNTVFTFTKSGPFYFISGRRENCAKNESLAVIVMSDHSPPSPRSGSGGLIPSSCPTSDEGSASGASAMGMGFIGTIGVLGSLFFGFGL